MCLVLQPSMGRGEESCTLILESISATGSPRYCPWPWRAITGREDEEGVAPGGTSATTGDVVSYPARRVGAGMCHYGRSLCAIMGGAHVPLWEELQRLCNKEVSWFWREGIISNNTYMQINQDHVFKMFTKLVIIREAINYCDLAGQTKCTHIAMPPSGQSAHIQVC